MAYPPSIYRGVNHESAQASLVRWTLSALRPAEHSIKCPALAFRFDSLPKSANALPLLGCVNAWMWGTLKFRIYFRSSALIQSKRYDENSLFSKSSQLSFLSKLKLYIIIIILFCLPLILFTKEKYFRSITMYISGGELGFFTRNFRDEIIQIKKEKDARRG